MIESRHTWFHTRFFDVYICWIIRKHFRSVKIINRGFKPASGAVLAISNHVSWWDGFWLYHLNREVFKKKFHVLMLEEQLKVRKFLSKIGAIGLRQGSRDVIKALTFCSQILKDEGNVLFYFPEGKINPMNHKKVHFQKGVMRLVENLDASAQLFFVASFVEYYSHKKPTLFINYKSVSHLSFPTIEELQLEYNAFLTQCREALNAENQ